MAPAPLTTIDSPWMRLRLKRCEYLLERSPFGVANAVNLDIINNDLNPALVSSSPSNNAPEGKNCSPHNKSFEPVYEAFLAKSCELNLVSMGAILFAYVASFTRCVITWMTVT